MMNWIHLYFWRNLRKIDIFCLKAIQYFKTQNDYQNFLSSFCTRVKEEEEITNQVNYLHNINTQQTNTCKVKNVLSLYSQKGNETRWSDEENQQIILHLDIEFFEWDITTRDFSSIPLKNQKWGKVHPWTNLEKIQEIRNIKIRKWIKKILNG